MSLFRRNPPQGATAPPSDAESQTVVGERSTAAVSRPASLQSRISNVLAMGLIGAMALGLIGWYYVHSLAGRTAAREAAETSARAKAQGEMVLPPLGRVEPPAAPRDPLASVLGPAPELPSEDPDAWGRPAHDLSTAYAAARPATPTPEELTLARKLSGAVFARHTPSASASMGVDRRELGSERAAMLGQNPGAVRGARGGDMDGLLQPSATPAASAEVLPTQTLLLPKGAFVDCTLETAIDSTLPGMTTCVTATDTFSADGKVVLLERGTKLVGETRGQVQQGSARVFVLWTEARTPTGVVVPLASPGTDELGRSGLPGEVDRHFLERFGAAILISVIDGAVQAAVQAQRDGDTTVIYSPSTSRDILTEVLKSTVNIPPTVVKPQGDQIQVLVARDLDFRSVYDLRPTAQR